MPEPGSLVPLATITGLFGGGGESSSTQRRRTGVFFNADFINKLKQIGLGPFSQAELGSLFGSMRTPGLFGGSRGLPFAQALANAPLAAPQERRYTLGDIINAWEFADPEKTMDLFRKKLPDNIKAVLFNPEGFTAAEFADIAQQIMNGAGDLSGRSRGGFARALALLQQQEAAFGNEPTGAFGPNRFVTGGLKIGPATNKSPLATIFGGGG
jgi:hypothetical protein